MAETEDDRQWKRIMEVASAHKLPLSLPEHLNDLINSRVTLIKKLQELSDEIHTQEIAVASVKTAGAVGTVGGTILLFTPFFPLGAAITACSSAACLATTIGDLIGESYKEKRLDKLLKEDKRLATLFIDDMAMLDALCRAFLEKKLVTSTEKGYGIAIGVAMVVKSIGTTALTSIALYKPLKTIFVDGIIALTGSKAALGFVSLSVGVFTAIVCVADCVISWLTVKPSRQTADKAIKACKEATPRLKELKDLIDRFTTEIKKNSGG